MQLLISNTKTKNIQSINLQHFNFLQKNKPYCQIWILFYV
jgi:hypothetical protein